jgi:hypothetical protein
MLTCGGPAWPPRDKHNVGEGGAAFSQEQPSTKKRRSASLRAIRP